MCLFLERSASSSSSFSVKQIFIFPSIIMTVGWVDYDDDNTTLAAARVGNQLKL